MFRKNCTFKQKQTIERGGDGVQGLAKGESAADNEYFVYIYLEYNILVITASSRLLDLFLNLTGDHNFTGAMMSDVWEAGQF